MASRPASNSGDSAVSLRIAAIACSGQLDDRLGHGLGRQDRIRHAGIDGALRHIGELGVPRIFDDRPPTRGPDLRKPQGAVAAGAGQQDAAAAVPPVGGQGAEEVVDRHPQAVALDRFLEA